ESHVDGRGSLTEIFRSEWPGTFHPLQWNYVRSEPNVLRGVHVHFRHHDYLVLVEGRMHLYLHDIRRDSETAERNCDVELVGDRLGGVATPPGVAHGFYFSEPAALIYSVSEYWNLDDELGCRWDSPGLNMRIGVSSPLLSPRDEKAGSFAEMVRAYAAHRARAPAAAETA